MNRLKTHARAGFTLTEIIIAVAIVGTMLGIGMAAYRYLAKAKVTSTKATLRVLKGAVHSFHEDTGHYPDLLRDLIRRPTNAEIAQEWDGPYLDSKQEPKDGWKQKFKYAKTPGSEHPYDLYSKGEPDAQKKKKINVWDL